MTDELNFNATTSSTSEYAAPQTDDASQRREKILALLRGRMHWAVILSILIGGGLGYLGYTSVDPLYRSTGKVRLERTGITGKGGDIFDTGAWAGFAREQQSFIVSAPVAQRGLDTEAWKSRPDDAEPFDVGDFAGAITLEMNESNRNDNLFEVSFSAADPTTAEAGCRAAIQAYREEFNAVNLDSTVNEIKTRQRIIEDRKRYETNQLAMRRTIMSDAAVDQLATEMSTMLAWKLDLEVALSDVRAQIESRNPVKAGMSTAPGDLINADPTLQSLQQEKEFYEDEIKRLEAQGFGPGHYRMKQSINARDVVVAKMEERIQLLLNQEDIPMLHDSEFEELRRQEQRLHRQLVDVSTNLEKLNEKQTQIAGYNSEIDKTRAIIADLNEQIDGLELNRGTGIAIREVSYGIKPKVPFNSGKSKQLAVLGSLGGVFLGFGSVMLLGAMDRRLRHAGDARMGMRDTRMLGILPTLPENFADPEQSEKAAHAVHHIRTLLQISNRGTARVFSVTSPAAGSGKSSLTVALGLSFAASESKTLVIDCDLVGAGLTRRVGAVVNRSVEAILREDTVLTDEQIDEAIRTARERGINLKDSLVELGMLTKKDLQRLNRRQTDSALGILDACHGRSFSECVANTGIDNFYVLPIGAAKPQDAGLLSPKAMRSLIARAREEYDIVLIDTGPCLGSLEASMAAAEADATVLIVSRGDAKSMASRAVEHLKSVGANVVGVVFNHALDVDLNHSSFASIVSQERRTDPAASLLAADPAAAARFGPLGSAVAAFGTPSKSPNGQPRRIKAANGVASNGH